MRLRTCLLLCLTMLSLSASGQYYRIDLNTHTPSESPLIDNVFYGNTPFIEAYLWEGDQAIDMTPWTMVFKYSYGLYDTNGMDEILGVMDSSNRVLFLGGTNLFFEPYDDYHYEVVGTHLSGYTKTFGSGRMIQEYSQGSDSNTSYMIGQWNMSWWSNNVGAQVESNRVAIDGLSRTDTVAGVSTRVTVLEGQTATWATVTDKLDSNVWASAESTTNSASMSDYVVATAGLWSATGSNAEHNVATSNALHLARTNFEQRISQIEGSTSFWNDVSNKLDTSTYATGTNTIWDRLTNTPLKTTFVASTNKIWGQIATNSSRISSNVLQSTYAGATNAIWASISNQQASVTNAIGVVKANGTTNPTAVALVFGNGVTNHTVDGKTSTLYFARQADVWSDTENVFTNLNLYEDQVLVADHSSSLTLIPASSSSFATNTGWSFEGGSSWDSVNERGQFADGAPVPTTSWIVFTNLYDTNAVYEIVFTVSTETNDSVFWSMGRTNMSKLSSGTYTQYLVGWDGEPKIGVYSTNATPAYLDDVYLGRAGKEAVLGVSGHLVAEDIHAGTVDSSEYVLIGNTNSATGGAINGGIRNSIDAGAYYSTINGGLFNQIEPSGFYGVIGGGTSNEVHAQYSTIGGGQGNKIYAQHCYIGFGVHCYIYTGATDSVIMGGYQNLIYSNAYYSSIAGGHLGRIGQQSYCSAILGGEYNFVGETCKWSSVLGGFANVVSNQYSMSGGVNSHATEQSSLALQYYARATNAGSAVFGGNVGAVSHGVNSFNTAPGGWWNGVTIVISNDHLYGDISRATNLYGWGGTGIVSSTTVSNETTLLTSAGIHGAILNNIPTAGVNSIWFAGTNHSGNLIFTGSAVSVAGNTFTFDQADISGLSTTYLSVAGGVMSGDVDMGENKITNVASLEVGGDSILNLLDVSDSAEFRGDFHAVNVDMDEGGVFQRFDFLTNAILQFKDTPNTGWHRIYATNINAREVMKIDAPALVVSGAVSAIQFEDGTNLLDVGTGLWNGQSIAGGGGGTDTGAVQKVGDTMTGDLVMSSANGIRITSPTHEEIAIGKGNPTASNKGIAIGEDASSDTGVAVGGDATGASDGVGLGQFANGNFDGVAVGERSTGSSGAVGLGFWATANIRSVAVGYYANANENCAVAVGSESSATDTNIAIGCNVTNEVPDSVAFRGSRFYMMPNGGADTNNCIQWIGDPPTQILFYANGVVIDTKP